VVARVVALAQDNRMTAMLTDKTRTSFAYRSDVWNDAGDTIVEHVASIEDYDVARAAYDRACRRWPMATVTLRQGTRVLEDSRRRTG
jgi:hypothetical protein